MWTRNVPRFIAKNVFMHHISSPAPQPLLKPGPPVPVVVWRARETVGEEQETQHHYHNSLRKSLSM